MHSPHTFCVHLATTDTKDKYKQATLVSATHYLAAQMQRVVSSAMPASCTTANMPFLKSVENVTLLREDIVKCNQFVDWVEQRCAFFGSRSADFRVFYAEYSILAVIHAALIN